MAETFYGAWLIDVVGKDAAFGQRYVVSGSDRADGAYLADIGSPRIQVSGAEWTLALEWNNNVGSGWQPSRVIRQSVTFDINAGLIVVLGVDDNALEYADNDFNDLIIRCQNIDPHLIPWYPHRNTVDFRLPRRKGGDHNNPGKEPGKDSGGKQIPDPCRLSNDGQLRPQEC